MGSTPKLTVLEGGRGEADAQDAPGRGATADDAWAGPLDLDAAFRRYAPYVARIAMRLLGSAEQVDDVVQDVFLDAHRGLHRLRSHDALKGWLATVTVRKVRRRLQREKLMRFVGIDTVIDRGRLVIGGSAELGATLTAVYRELDRQPVDDRIAWVLHYVEGYTVDEIAARCGCSRSTANRRALRVQAHLEEVFRD